MTDDATRQTLSKEAPMAESLDKALLDQKLVSAEVTDTEVKKNTTARVVLTVVLIILLILIFASCAGLFGLLGLGSKSASDTGGIGWVRSIYGFGSGINQRHNPQSVAVAPDGNSLWVVDTSRRRLIEYDMSGSFRRVVTSYKGQPSVPAIPAADGGSEFLAPSAIAIAPNGWFYVAEQTYNHVLILDQNFQLKNELLVMWPHSLAVNSEMLLIGGNGGIAAYKTDGTFIGTNGEIGSEPDQFDRILGVALDSDSNAYVVDSYNNRLNKFDAAGDLVWQIETGPPANEGNDSLIKLSAEEAAKKWPATMQIPQGVCIDGAGRVVVIDFFDFTVAAFDPDDGTFLGKWGTYGTADGQFNYPNALAYNRSQDVYISTEAVLGRVQIFRLPDSGGNLLSGLRRSLSGVLRSCCWPLLIILLIIALYYLYQYLTRKRRRRQQLEVPEQGEAPEMLKSKEVSSSSSKE